MSQYSGNDTSFKPRYAVSGETSTPISVISKPLTINGHMIEGYQSTYANGTSKWTPHVLTDSGRLVDSHGVDKSTFTGKKIDGKWTWIPTNENSIKELAKHYRGPDRERITTDQINSTFYSKDGVTLQSTLKETQIKVIEQEVGEENLKTANNGNFATITNTTQSNENGAVDADLTSVDITTSIESDQIRTEYDNYYYPYDIRSNKQDRMIFKMKQSTGSVIDPSVKKNVEAFQRKSSPIAGSVTLPIPAGIKDSNIVDWGKEKMNPLQAFGAAAVMNMGEAAFKDGIEGAAAEVAKTVNQGRQILVKDTGARQAVNAFIAGQAVGTKNLLSRATGAIANPNLELLFNAPGLRAFQFTFQMSPRDSNEAKQIRNIINFFKQGMAVKTTNTNVFLKAPNYFDIDYISFNDNGEMMKHPSLNIIKTCALLTCSVDYTPNNAYMTYSDNDRSMVSYTMSLQFGELDPIYESDYFTRLSMQNGTNVQEIGF